MWTFAGFTSERSRIASADSCDITPGTPAGHKLASMYSAKGEAGKVGTRYTPQLTRSSTPLVAIILRALLLTPRATACEVDT